VHIYFISLKVCLYCSTVPSIVQEREPTGGQEYENRPHSIIENSYDGASISGSTSKSSSNMSDRASAQTKYPKRGTTRMPSRLVSKKVLVDLGYSFTEEVGLIYDLLVHES
jgi:hypothetical protein